MADGGNVVEAGAFQISANAARRIATLIASEGADSHLRVGVSGGGCSGFQYNFELEAADPSGDDKVFTRDGAVVVVDETSLELLGGAEIDFVEDLSGSFFQMRNPNAQSSCGCGMSFAVA